MQRASLPSRAFSTSMPVLAAPAQRPEYRNWRVDPPCAGADGQTFQHQSRLPPLPVPELSATLRKLRASGCAVARDNKEAAVFEEALNAFAKSTTSQKLQDRLCARAQGMKNWLAEQWDRLAYMSFRDSVVCNVSYFYGFNRLPQKPGPTQFRETDSADPAYVAASIAAYATWHRDQLASGSIPPDQIGKSTVCMESYKWLYNACRIPARGEDYGVKVREDDARGDHFVLIYKNRHYKVPLRDDTGQTAGLQQFWQAIRDIQVETTVKDAPLGALTGINRDTWAQIREELLENSVNSASLRAIEDAAFVIALDDAKPSTVGNDPAKRADFSEKLWKGDAGSRFYDKPLQWVVFASGESGVIGEHSCMDGTPTAALNDQLSRDLIAGRLPPDPGSSGNVVATALEFQLGQTMLARIAEAEDEYARHVGGFELRYLLYTKYGKDQIKACGTSPDGWVQMVMQLAYALTHDGRSPPTYESAQTRRFALGRTEVVRICTQASRAFASAMVGSNVDRNTKRQLFRAAVEQQGLDMKDASAALGIDRHLLGLKGCLQPHEDVPKLFQDPVFLRSSHWQMSTSQVYGRQFSAYGWGPVVEDGFGVPYMIHPESLMFTITAHRGMPIDEMITNVGRACDMVLDLMKSESKL